MADIKNISAAEMICSSCGKRYILRECDREKHAYAKSMDSERCFSCNRILADQRKQRAEQQKKMRDQKQWESDQAKFLELLNNWNVVSLEEIVPKDDRVLYILGNGFDLMHAVPSSYTSFRDSLSKNNNLRWALETFWKAGTEIWADFEEELANFDMNCMGAGMIVDNFLDDVGAYDEDAGAAEYFMAQEMAAGPITSVVEELPKRFQKWVETLSVGTDDRPLNGIIKGGKVLNFNYTEFVEDLYGIPGENVCYLHGRRRRNGKKHSDPLILGHMQGASDDSYELGNDHLPWKRDAYQKYLLETAQDGVFRIVSRADEALTKNTKDIIAKHKEFFQGLKDISTVIVIGHSMSRVDWDYFDEIVNQVEDLGNIHWYFGCHGLRDLRNLEALLNKIGVSYSAVSVFRTDQISVSLLDKGKTDTDSVTKPKVKAYQRDESENGKWLVTTTGSSLKIVNLVTGAVEYQVELSEFVNDAFFLQGDTLLIVVIRGANSGVLLFGYEAADWHLINELEAPQNQYMINNRLRHVYVNDKNLTFVYNNRVTVYSLANGNLISTRHIKHAWERSYDGIDIYSRLTKSYGDRSKCL